ncbi:MULTISPECIES: response regulator [Streptomyces]|jgi:DNA-binding NarL/FixJ family response regulator|uniref:LuxR family transcriptional regulator n=5 Tax=Streptomyces TaxID=1883 RepID=A0A0B5HWV7_9ACTN|nr:MULTISPECIES: response regulator transcription factor [Streptomyces]AJF66460.1 LuxR family transcriptional regulator [Streptomyces vietnamensis]APE23040.1 DNA-binding response regulator [Streptomyces venezuelae]QES00422.1 DNA-binding response regulator [Streptomyces venezuelae ATCC 10712]ROQ33431.1 LuxR family two component transcriptional regulator [Streptomyces sp. PanSC19]UZX22597.1 response regulator transcription factor [Streptomyces tanashiensis]
MSVRILLCDDHVVVRAGLLALLGSTPDIEVVGEAGSGEEAVAMAAKLKPDVVLMDLQLGAGIDGVEATRRIAPTGVHVLVLTTYDTDADITRAIEAGATGYLLKAERPEELFAAIHSAAQGRTALSPPVASRVMDRMRGAAGPSLTDRERDILGQLGRGLGNREIARALFISEATVKTHLGRIYAKLGVDTRAGAVAVAKERRLLP